MYLYVGNGLFLWGVPARDLTDAEAEVYGVTMLLASNLYVKEAPKENKAGKPASENKEHK